MPRRRGGVVGQVFVCPDGTEAAVEPDTVASIEAPLLRRVLIVSLYARGVDVERLTEVFNTSRMTVYREIHRLDPGVASRVAQAI